MRQALHKRQGPGIKLEAQAEGPDGSKQQQLMKKRGKGESLKEMTGNRAEGGKNQLSFLRTRSKHISNISVKQSKRQPSYGGNEQLPYGSKSYTANVTKLGVPRLLYSVEGTKGKRKEVIHSQLRCLKTAAAVYRGFQTLVLLGTF